MILRSNPVDTPFWNVTWSGTDVTADIAPFVVSFIVIDKKEGESDELELVLEDREGRWRNGWVPSKGDVLEASFGYRAGEVIDGGTFQIDELEHEWPPDQLRMRAIAAGLSKQLRTKRHRSFEDRTLPQIAAEIAADHGMTVIGDPATEPLDRVSQADQNDLEFLSKLAAEHGYVFSVRGDTMVFMVDEELLAADAVATVSRAKHDPVRGRFRRTAKQIYKACEVTYSDPGTKDTMKVTVTASGRDRAESLLQIARILGKWTHADAHVFRAGALRDPVWAYRHIRDYDVIDFIALLDFRDGESRDVRGGMDGFAKANPEVFRLGLTLMGAATAAALVIGPAMMAFGAIASGAGMALAAIGALIGPLGLIAAAVAGGALLIYRNWESVTAFFDGLWSGMLAGMEPLQPAFDAVAAAVAPIMEAGAGLLTWVQSLFAPVEGLSGAAGELGRSWGAALGAMAAAMAAPWLSEAAELIAWSWGQVPAVLELVSGAVTGFVARAQVLAGPWLAEAARLMTWAWEQVPAVFTLVSGAVAGFAARVQVLAGPWLAEGARLMAWAWEQVPAVFTLVSGAITGFVNEARALAGPWLAEGAGLAVSAWDKLPAVFNGVGDAVNRAMAWVQQFTGGFVAGFSAAFDPSRFTAIAETFGPLVNAFGELWRAATSLFGGVTDLFGGMNEAAGSAGSFGDAVGRLAGGALNTAADLIRTMATVATGLAQALAGVLRCDVGAVMEGWKTAFGGVLTFFDTLSQRLTGLSLFDAGAAILQGLANGLTAGATAALAAIEGIGSSIIGRFKSLLGIASPSTVFAQFGSWIMDGLAGGLMAKVQSVLDSVSGVASGVVGRFKSLLGINSPSTVFAGFGLNLIQGLENGINDNGSDAATAAARLSQTVAAAAAAAAVAIPLSVTAAAAGTTDMAKTAGAFPAAAPIIELGQMAGMPDMAKAMGSLPTVAPTMAPGPMPRMPEMAPVAEPGGLAGSAGAMGSGGGGAAPVTVNLSITITGGGDQDVVRRLETWVRGDGARLIADAVDRNGRWRDRTKFES